jgi:rod shape-determining protein MreD
MPPDKPHGAAMAGVILSFIMAMILRILPLPPDWFAFNPDWLALLLIYWTLLAPERVGIVTAWLVGFFADVLTGRLFGQHALAYAAIAYINLHMRQRLLGLPLLVQCIWVFCLLLLAQLLIMWTQRMEMAESMRVIYWLPSLTGALAWPLVYGVMQRLGQLGVMRGS